MIKTIEIRNFKAIEKVKVKLSPLTAFIGYNGTGKSSLLEGLEMFKALVTEGLDRAIRPWKEFEHIYYKGKKKSQKFTKGGIEHQFSPIEFLFSAYLSQKNGNKRLSFSTAIGQEKTDRRNMFFISEKVNHGLFERVRDADNHYIKEDRSMSEQSPDKSILSSELEISRYVESWQFLSMNTFLMGDAFPQKKTNGIITLNKDGRNIAEYLLSIREKDVNAYQGIIETLSYVLPYAKDLQPQITTELERMVYLQMTEQDFKLPGWMLSTGTLKILAILAVFRNPEPSPLIVIEELENGLDPRAIHLVITEIQHYLDQQKGQVLITSHSPYLLDLLHISHIIFVARKNDAVCMSRPADNQEVMEWSKKYAPGQLYTQKGF